MFSPNKWDGKIAIIWKSRYKSNATGYFCSLVVSDLTGNQIICTWGNKLLLQQPTMKLACVSFNGVARVPDHTTGLVCVLCLSLAEWPLVLCLSLALPKYCNSLRFQGWKPKGVIVPRLSLKICCFGKLTQLIAMFGDVFSPNLSQLREMVKTRIGVCIHLKSVRPWRLV